MSTINGVDLDALDDTVEAVTNQRDLGRVTFSVDSAWRAGSALRPQPGALCRLAGPTTRGRSVRHVERRAGCTPWQRHCRVTGRVRPQALAGCYTVTLAADAAARGITLDGYRLHLEADFDLAGFLGVDKDQSPGPSRSASKSSSTLRTRRGSSWTN